MFSFDNGLDEIFSNWECFLRLIYLKTFAFAKIDTTCFTALSSTLECAVRVTGTLVVLSNIYTISRHAVTEQAARVTVASFKFTPMLCTMSFKAYMYYSVHCASHRKYSCLVHHECWWIVPISFDMLMVLSWNWRTMHTLGGHSNKNIKAWSSNIDINGLHLLLCNSIQLQGRMMTKHSGIPEWQHPLVHFLRTSEERLVMNEILLPSTHFAKVWYDLLVCCQDLQPQVNRMLKQRSGLWVR